MASQRKHDQVAYLAFTGTTCHRPSLCRSECCNSFVLTPISDSGPVRLSLNPALVDDANKQSIRCSMKRNRHNERRISGPLLPRPRYRQERSGCNFAGENAALVEMGARHDRTDRSRKKCPFLSIV